MTVEQLMCLKNKVSQLDVAKLAMRVELERAKEIVFISTAAEEFTRYETTSDF